MSEFSSRSDSSQKMTVWTRGCLLAAGLALTAVVVMTAGSFGSHRRPCPQWASQRINPNTASMASLVRLPGIGKARAMDMIHYREQQPGERAFESADDLQAIRGIGPKTAAKLAPWLVFEEEPPAAAKAMAGQVNEHK